MILKFDDPVEFLRAVLARLEDGAEIHRKVDYAKLSLISRAGVMKRCRNSKSVHVYHHRMMSLVLVDKVNQK